MGARAVRLTLWAALVAADASDAPHIILSVADDLGWHNVGWHNPEFRTPTLDALRSEGVELTRHYTFMYCSPSRAALLSGRLPLHVNQNNQANEIISRAGADARMSLLPRRLGESAARYYCVAIGKWHLGARTPAALPHARGFDEHLGYLKGGVRHFTQGSHDGGVGSPHDPPHAEARRPLARRRARARRERRVRHVALRARGRARDRRAPRRRGRGGGGDDAAAAAADDDALAARPLFMYLAWQNPHMQPEVPAMYLNHAIGDCKRRTIEAMVHVLDEGIANVTRALARRAAACAGRGRWNTTVFVFCRTTAA